MLRVIQSSHPCLFRKHNTVFHISPELLHTVNIIRRCVGYKIDAWSNVVKQDSVTGKEHSKHFNLMHSFFVFLKNVFSTVIWIKFFVIICSVTVLPALWFCLNISHCFFAWWVSFVCLNSSYLLAWARPCVHSHPVRLTGLYPSSVIW